MKRHVQELGVRRWYADDILELQSEPFKVTDGFFGEYDDHIISGCKITPNGDKYDVSSGLVILTGEDPEGEAVRVVAPFTGVTSVILPAYLSLSYTIHEDTYVSGLVKPIAVEYFAELSNIAPEGSHIEITTEGVTRFVDAIQSSERRFVTDGDIINWNGKEDKLLAESITTELLADGAVTPQKLSSEIRYIPCFVTLNPEVDDHYAYLSTSESRFAFIKTKRDEPVGAFGVMYRRLSAGGAWQIFIKPELVSRIMVGSIQVSLVSHFVGGGMLVPNGLFVGARLEGDVNTPVLSVVTRVPDDSELDPTNPEQWRVNISFLIKG